MIIFGRHRAGSKTITPHESALREGHPTDVWEKCMGKPQQKSQSKMLILGSKTKVAARRGREDTVP